MKNIHIIKTPKPSRLFIHNAFNDLRLDTKNVLHDNNQHIYITSDEEIKEGDKDFYIIANDRDKTWINRLERVVECKIDPFYGKVLILFSEIFLWVDEGKKIILTTDTDLISDGVQAINDSFLEWFVHNPSCEWVETFIDTMGCTLENCDANPCINYKIIIPKEEPCTCKKHDPYCCQVHGMCPTCVKKEEPKQELHKCKYCGVETTQPDDECYAKPKQENCCTPIGQIKRYIDCKGCDRKPKQGWQPTQGEEVWIKVFSNWSKGTYMGYDTTRSIHLVRECEEGGGNLLSSGEILPYYSMPNEPKQETLEEAAEKYADFSNDYVPLAFGSKFNETTKRDFIEGAKWQQEQDKKLYSEEEVLNILDKFLTSMVKGEKTGLTEKWFEQFKK